MNGHPRTAEEKAEHGRRTREGIARKRAQRRILVSHLDSYRHAAAVHPSLMPAIRAAQEWIGDLVQALGGPSEITPQQQALLDQLAQAAVVRSAAFAAFAADGNLASRALERFNGAANIERAGLQLLGLERRAKPVPTLREYLARQAAQDASGPTIAAQPDSTIEPNH